MTIDTIFHIFFCSVVIYFQTNVVDVIGPVFPLGGMLGSAIGLGGATGTPTPGSSNAGPYILYQAVRVHTGIWMLGESYSGSCRNNPVMEKKELRYFNYSYKNMY